LKVVYFPQSTAILHMHTMQPHQRASLTANKEEISPHSSPCAVNVILPTVSNSSNYTTGTLMFLLSNFEPKFRMTVNRRSTSQRLY